MTEQVGNNTKILIIDDELQIINALKRALQGEGYAILSTTDPHEAFDLIDGNEIDIVICDQRMPMLSGTDLMIYVKKKDPKIIRILMSGYSDIDAVVDAINKGNIYYYISKPWSNENIVNILRNAVIYRHELVRSEQMLRSSREAAQKSIPDKAALFEQAVVANAIPTASSCP